MGVNLPEHRRNEILEETKVGVIAMGTRGRRLQWFRLVKRTAETENIRKGRNGTLTGRNGKTRYPTQGDGGER